ncbi:ATP-dependent helicase [Burkholderia sp. Ac-20365]|uniref:ATP-dependent helicase n=1 Tax=Burkholderia sp. Ac-20365 TaxID=2703897 RepID=UPI00197C7BA3|nr:ATP-dependent helicase [Burkholderia sp. Ac-20365]MBN3760958.1 ATP-dependent helicase [Burkholderia sp. Ac-20365]
MRADVLDGLNDDQRAVATCERNAMVIAGPGSGKTSTLARKASLILQDPGRRLAAVTFTREAALELRERIVKLAGEECMPRLLVGTFHSTMQMMSFPHLCRGKFATEIMSSAKSGFGKKQWEIARESVRRLYISRAMAHLGLDMEIEDASRIIEQVKSGRPAEEKIHEDLAYAYADVMERNGVIDFQDILLKTIQGLKDGHVTPLNVTDMFIDEYQDTDLVQFNWAEQHYLANVRLTGVGDDDQSIYGFRNALGYEGMLRFCSMFRAEQLMLGRNYRSHQEVLGPSVNVIRNNQGRIDKHLVANKGVGGAARWQTFGSRNDEAFAAASYGFDALRSNATVGILARTNRRLDDVEANLSARGIPYRRPPGESVLNRQEVEIFGTALQTIFKPDARSLDALLGWNGVGEDDLKGIKRAFNGQMIVGSPDDFRRNNISDDGKKRWQDFVKLFTGWQHSLNSGVENLLIHGVYEWLLIGAPDNRSKKMLEIAKEIYQPRRADANGNPAQSIKERLAAVKRAQDDRKEKENLKETVVELMTAHGSKGLEFDHVWIIGAEEGTFPAKDGALEEERRLMYVAMTRSRKDLVISTGGGSPPSLFIAESGIERVYAKEEESEAVA